MAIFFSKSRHLNEVRETAMGSSGKSDLSRRNSRFKSPEVGISWYVQGTKKKKKNARYIHNLK